MEQLHEQEIISSDEEIEQIKIYTDPAEYLSWCKADKKIKIMDEMNPLLNNVYLKDISLHKKGPMEDKIYSKRPLYYWNIRRGNTLCQIYENQKVIDLFFCRRGMIKFFDLEPKFLEGNKSHLVYKQSLVRKVIFGQLDQKLTEGGYQFHLYSLFKQNGEHCQIAYLEKLDAWIFASKNVSIIVRNQQDIEQYHKLRFYWAKLIAEQFLQTVNNMTNEAKIQFKKDISNKTLIGEYCGYQKHQHITKYQKRQIIFYAVVENVGDQSCLPVDEAFKLFDKYNLRKVQTQTFRGLINRSEVYQKIYELAKKIAMGSMDVVGEGSVLYIVAQKDGKQRTVSLSKLKSAEYLIFRKLRQMLKINLSKKGETANTINKFKFQVQQIVKQLFNPPFPLDYYYKIAQIAFKQVGDQFQNMDQGELRYRFVAFLDNVINKRESVETQVAQKPLNNSSFKRLILVCLPKTLQDNFSKNYKQKGIKFQQIYRQGMQTNKPTVSVLHMVPRVSDPQKHVQNLFLVCRYSNEQISKIVESLNAQKQPYNQNIINFIKSQDKQKQISLLNSKIIAFEKQCEEKGFNYISIKDQNKNQQIQDIINKEFCGLDSSDKKEQNDKPMRYIVVPFLLPGSGKTTLVKALQSLNIKMTVMQSDQIRRKVYKKLQQSNDNKYSPAELFELSKGQVLAQWKLKISQLLATPVQKVQIVYIDRIFSPTALEQVQQLQNPNNYFIFLTQNGTGWRNNDAEYPFSVTYLLNCFKRCIERQGHEVLENDPVETMKIVLKFYQMFKNTKLNFLQKKYPRSKIVKLPFVNQTPQDDEQLSSTLKNKIKQCLKAINPGYDAHPSISFNELIEIYYTTKIPQRNPQMKQLVQMMKQQFPIKF